MILSLQSERSQRAGRLARPAEAARARPQRRSGRRRPGSAGARRCRRSRSRCPRPPAPAAGATAAAGAARAGGAGDRADGVALDQPHLRLRGQAAGLERGQVHGEPVERGRPAVDRLVLPDLRRAAGPAGSASPRGSRAAAGTRRTRWCRGSAARRGRGRSPGPARRRRRTRATKLQGVTRAAARASHPAAPRTPARRLIRLFCLNRRERRVNGVTGGGPIQSGHRRAPTLRTWTSSSSASIST